MTKKKAARTDKPQADKPRTEKPQAKKSQADKPQADKPRAKNPRAKKARTETAPTGTAETGTERVRKPSPVIVTVNPADNVAVAIESIARGNRIALEDGALVARNDIPKNHKVALKAIRAGARVLKYGQSIGLARIRIEPGEWVHVHNLTAEES